MKLIAISDIHSKVQMIEKLKSIAGAELVVVAGDLTHFGGKREADDILKRLSAVNSNVLAVPGNCDNVEVNRALVEGGVSVHGAGKIIGDIGFFGAGGSTTTPFNTPQEYPEEEVETLLRQGYKAVKNCEKKVLVSHSPPFGTLVDKTKGGEHVGSKLLRAFVEDVKPDLVLCGHAHEARGHDKLEKTLLINPGPLHMGCVRVSIGERINFEFVRF